MAMVKKFQDIRNLLVSKNIKNDLIGINLGLLFYGKTLWTVKKILSEIRFYFILKAALLYAAHNWSEL